MKFDLLVRFWAAVVTLLLVGCATVQKAPPSEEAAAKAFTTKPDKAKLYVYRRPALLWARGQTAPVTVDGIVVAGLRPGHFIVVEVDPGNHVVTSPTMDSKGVHAEAGRNYFIHQNQTVTGSWIRLMEEKEGKAEVTRCKLLLKLTDGYETSPAENRTRAMSPKGGEAAK